MSGRVPDSADKSYAYENNSETEDAPRSSKRANESIIRRSFPERMGFRDVEVVDKQIKVSAACHVRVAESGSALVPIELSPENAPEIDPQLPVQITSP